MIFMAIWNLVKNENRELPNFDDLRVVFFFFFTYSWTANKELRMWTHLKHNQRAD